MWVSVVVLAAVALVVGAAGETDIRFDFKGGDGFFSSL